MTTEQLAIVSASAVGLAGVLSPTLTAWRDRAHQRYLAQSERTYGRRSRVYEKAGAFLERHRMAIHRTEPVIGPTSNPPPPLPDDEWAELEGSVAVGGSTEAHTAIREAYKATNAFVRAVIAYRGDASAWEQMLESRQQALDAIDEAERVMRDELASM